MGSISFSGRKSFNSAGWSGWGSVPATAIDYCYDGTASSTKQHVVYRATVNYSSGQTLTEVSLKTNFALYQYSRYDNDYHDTDIWCYVYDFDPTSSNPNGIRPSGEIGSDGGAQPSLGYWGRAITFNMSVYTQKTTLWFWFEDSPSYVAFDGLVYKDAVFSYATGNEYTETPTISARFNGGPEPTDYTIEVDLLDFDGMTVFRHMTIKSGVAFTMPTKSTRQDATKTFVLSPNANGGTLSDPTQKGSARRSGYILNTALDWEGYGAGGTYTIEFEYSGYETWYCSYITDYDNVNYSVNINGLLDPYRDEGPTLYSTVVCSPNHGGLPSDIFESYADATFEFDGWYTSASGGRRVETSSGEGTIEYDNDAVIYAHWRVVSWTSDPSEITLPTYTRSSWVGAGFSESKYSKQPTYYFGQTIVPIASGSLYLYAIWILAGVVYIYHDGLYHLYETYIYHDGSYKRFMPYIYHNGAYIACV